MAKMFEVYFDFADRCEIHEYRYGTSQNEIDNDYKEWVEKQKNDVKQGWSFRTTYKEGMLG